MPRRPIWTGVISFGLVTIPVALYSATEDHSFHFNQLQRGTSDRIRYRRVNERTGEEVAYSDIVKGYDLGGGEYVVIEPDELEEIAPGRSRSVDIETFVDLADIDPIYFQRTYWLAPSDEKYAHAYALLLEAMEQTNRVGIATFVMRNKQYLTAVRADRGVLALETLYFADEVRDPEQTLPFLPEPGQAKGKELHMATALIESMSGPWEPEAYRDTYTERVEELIESKRTGERVAVESGPPRATEVVDLVDALQRSVGQPRRGKQSRESREGGGKARRGSRSEQRGQDLSELSKSELGRIARELDIAGRSKMSRAELERAVAEAGNGRGKRTA